ncbi:MAG TPA: SGNH/GDSL hydrolase family protein [Gemmatimonadaceae bacterium]|jgi:hypothetical protein|nr:SGNH/GDSL hydrolase family protein [Gemmatimonadaceae bacterium]
MRRWWERLALVVLFAVVLEATCRVEDFIRYGTPVWSRVRAKEDLIVLDDKGKHGRPHAQFGKWALNNLGMRGPDVSIAKPAGDVRVVVVGASETFGLYESPGHDYPRLLEDSLRALVARTPCARERPSDVEVLNAAIFGMSLPTVAQDLRLRVAPLHPDVVVAYPTPMYYLAPTTPDRTRPDSSGARDRLSPLSPLYPRTLDRLHDALKQVVPEWLVGWMHAREEARLQRHEPRGWLFTTVPPDRLAAYETDLRRLVGTVHAVHATPVLLTHVNASMDNRLDAAWMEFWVHQYPRATGAALIAFDSTADEVTVRVARDSGAALVDLASLARRGLFTPYSEYYADYAHFTDSGAERVAAAITPVVARTAHLVDDCAPSTVRAMQ